MLLIATLICSAQRLFAIRSIIYMVYITLRLCMHCIAFVFLFHFNAPVIFTCQLKAFYLLKLSMGCDNVLIGCMACIYAVMLSRTYN